MKMGWVVLAVALSTVSGQAPSAVTGQAQQMPMGEHDHMAAKPSVPSTSLTVTVDGKATTLTPADLAAMPQKTLVVKNGHSGAEETYAGPLVGEVLAKGGFAGAPGKPTLRSYVKAEGTDGYWVVYSASELEDGLRETGAIIALTLGGKPLEADGQFKIVEAGEKKPARWVRNLKALTVVTAP